MKNRRMGKYRVRYIFLFIGISGYILSILFNGYLRHQGLTYRLLQDIRPYLPEIFMSFIIVAWIISGIKLKKEDFRMWSILIVICFAGILTSPTIESVFSVIRDLIEPFILLGILSSIQLNDIEYSNIMKLIRNVFAIFVLFGIIFAIQQRIMGWEGISEYFAGYSFWGVNKEESLRVVDGWLGIRSLGTTGSSETFGFYNAFAIILFIYYGFRKKIANITIIVIAIVNILLSGLKTPLLIAVLCIFITVFLPNRKKMKLFSKVLICLIGIIMCCYMVLSSGTWTESSLFERLILWRSLLNFSRLINILFPYNVFSYSAEGGISGVYSTWDNTFLYLLFSIGIIGFVSVAMLLKNKWKRILSYRENNYITYLLFFIILSSITTCLFFGRNCISVGFIIIGIMDSNRRNILK